MIAFISNNNDLRIGIEGITMLPVEKPAELPFAQIEKYRGLIVDARNTRYALAVLTRIRSASNNNIFLKPVFLYSSTSPGDSYLAEISDGQIDSRNLMDSFHMADRIAEKCRNFQDFQGYNPEHYIVLKTLQFMVSRNADLTPVIMPKSKFGYLYPVITENFQERDDARMFEIVDFIEKENLADSRFVDRIRLCPNCSSSFINFREICPRCNSANLESDDLIHHFACGFVGPQSDYKQDDKLICVKCGKILRHIGMDYDKPSVIFNCRDCGYSFQEPRITGFCIYCQESYPGESLIIKDIKSFQISQVTVNCAMNGIILSLSDIINDTMKVSSNIAFRNIMEYEFKRQKRNKLESNLIYIQFKFEDNGSAGKESLQAIFFEIASEVKAVLRESDVITAINDETFAILLPDVTRDGAQKAMERLRERVSGFVAKNFPKIKTEILLDYLTVEEALSTDYFNKPQENG